MIKKNEPSVKFSENLKKILLLGTPLLAGRLTHYSHQVADSIMMGHFNQGGLELGALAVAGMYIWVLNTFLWPLGQGIQAIVSRRSGRTDERSNPESFGTVLDHGIITSLFFAVIAFLLSFLAGPFFRMILHDDQIIELALEYIGILKWSFFPFSISQIIMRFFSTVHKPRYSMTASIISNSVNILLNYIFIYGKLGFPEMGIRGAALGSLLSYIIGMIYVLSVALRKKHMSTYRFFHTRKIDFEIIKTIIRVASPQAVQNILAMLIMLFYEAMVENIGTVYLAATHIVFSFFRINKTIVGGFAQGTAILIGNALGAENHKASGQAMKAGYALGTAIGIIIFSTVFFLPSKIAGIFSAPGETFEIATTALRFFAPFYFFEIIGFSFEVVFCGNGWGKFVLFSEFTTNVVFILGFTFLVTRILGMGAVSAWWGFGLYQIFHSLILHIGFRSGLWKRAQVD